MVIDKSVVDLYKPLIVPNTMKAALIYPKYIPTTITISRNSDYRLPAFVSMINGPAEHHIKEVTIDAMFGYTNPYEALHSFVKSDSYKVPSSALYVKEKEKLSLQPIKEETPSMDSTLSDSSDNDCEECDDCPEC